MPPSIQADLGSNLASASNRLRDQARTVSEFPSLPSYSRVTPVLTPLGYPEAQSSSWASNAAGTQYKVRTQSFLAKVTRHVAVPGAWLFKFHSVYHFGNFSMWQRPKHQ